MSIGPAGAVRDHLTIERALIAIAGWSGDEAGALERAVDAMREPVADLRLCSDVSVEVDHGRARRRCLGRDPYP